MKRRRIGLGCCALALALSACRSTSPALPPPPPSPLEVADHLYEAADLGAAAEAYEAFLVRAEAGAAGVDRAIFRLAVIELTDPRRSTASGLRRLRDLVRSHPGSTYRSTAELLLSYEAEVRRLREQIEALKAIDLEPPPG